MSDLSLDHLRRRAKQLRKAYEAGDTDAIARISRFFRSIEALKHADFLHVIAKEHGVESWPKLKFAVESEGLDRVEKQQALRSALYHGQHWKVTALLKDAPDLAQGDFGLAVALYDAEAVRSALDGDPTLAVTATAGRRPIAHLTFSRHIQAQPDLAQAMLTIADLLLRHGADVNDFMPATQNGEHSLSVLYGALGHANNMPLAEWLLNNGADPDDGESLYHSTELGHHQGLDMLLAHGADPKGTNALLRAMDFDDHEAVRKLIAAGAEVEDFNDAEVGGEAPFVIPALHQAARRGNDRAMIEILMDAGADPSRLYDGVTAYAYARVFGSKDLVDAIEARGLATPLSDQEAILAHVAEGDVASGTYLDVNRLPDCYRVLLNELVNVPGRAEHIKRLVAIGLEYDRPDGMGLPPVQIAGWNGDVEMLAYFLQSRAGSHPCEWLWRQSAFDDFAWLRKCTVKRGSGSRGMRTDGSASRCGPVTGNAEVGRTSGNGRFPQRLGSAASRAGHLTLPRQKVATGVAALLIGKYQIRWIALGVGDG